MGRSNGRASLSGVKGGDLLAQLKQMLSPTPTPPPAAPAAPKSRRQDDTGGPSVEDELRAAAARRGAAPRAPQPVRRTKKGEPQKERIHIKDAALRRAILAEVKAIGVSDRSAARQTAKTVMNDFGEAAFKKVQTLRRSLEGFTATHGGGDGGSLDDKDLIHRRIRAGAVAAPTIEDRNDGFFIGYDFGTSTTKAVARNPYAGTGVAFAIDVPLSIASGGQPHLWPTVIWWNAQSKKFSLCPEEGYVCLDSFKSALLEGRAQRICSGTGMTMAEASAAFLASHLAYVFGTASEREQDFKVATINFGVPVAAMAQDETVAFFDRVIRAALFLVPLAGDLTLDDVRAAITNGETSPIQYELYTELAGAIAGYCAAPRYYIGGHMIIDCGSATLDIASFLLDGRSDKPVAIYSARVEPLGADACSTYAANGADADECKKAARYQEHLVYARTLKFGRHGFEQFEKKFPYQIILTGGGIHSDFHHPLFDTMKGAFHRAFHIPELERDLEYDERCEAGRLILADGLARDPIELREVAMPGDPPPPISSGPEMISKDQV